MDDSVSTTTTTATTSSTPAMSVSNTSCRTTPASAGFLEEICRMEQVGLKQTILFKELEEEISGLEEKKKTMAGRLEDNKVLMAERSEDYQTKRREADEARMNAAENKDEKTLFGSDSESGGEDQEE